ncbi:MAG TPA: GDP-L-fucose synthase [Candidatus Babeliaceae bacterium]|nr:GDP-L-fucose synthase [Candidatus Babeliaceae bacterium]
MNTLLFLLITLLSVKVAIPKDPPKTNLKQDSKILIAGANGLVGSAVKRRLEQEHYSNILTPSRQELDYTNRTAVYNYFEKNKPEYVIIGAARVGGIQANDQYPALFITDNTDIELNLIKAAHDCASIKKLIFLGSSCIYPRKCPQPMKEEYLLTGPLEKTNEWYAIAKILGLKLCQAYKKQYGDNFISCMPTNLYGIGDNFDLETSHVLPALIAKIIDAHEQDRPTVTIWGTGQAKREFLYVDDLADAIIFLLKNYDGDQWINVGTGQDCTIAELAQEIANIVGYKGQFVYNTTKPDGTPRKLLDVSKLEEMGWKAPTSLRKGLEKTIAWYKEHKHEARHTTHS